MYSAPGVMEHVGQPATLSDCPTHLSFHLDHHDEDDCDDEDDNYDHVHDGDGGDDDDDICILQCNCGGLMETLQTVPRSMSLPHFAR